jgi:hypothetical protein
MPAPVSVDEKAAPERPHNLVRLIATIEKFTESSDTYAKRLIYLTWALIALTLLLAVLTVMTIDDARKSASLQTDITLNGQFYNEPVLSVIRLIDANKPILQANKGPMTTFDLDTYLGTYEVIYSAYARHLLDEEDFCVSFYYYLNLTNKNAEISAYIADQRKTDAPDNFQGFLDLVKIAAKSKEPSCR